jgi:hypothetical protein
MSPIAFPHHVEMLFGVVLPPHRNKSMEERLGHSPIMSAGVRNVVILSRLRLSGIGSHCTNSLLFKG